MRNLTFALGHRIAVPMLDERSVSIVHPLPTFAEFEAEPKEVGRAPKNQSLASGTRPRAYQRSGAESFSWPSEPHAVTSPHDNHGNRGQNPQGASLGRITIPVVFIAAMRVWGADHAFFNIQIMGRMIP